MEKMEKMEKIDIDIIKKPSREDTQRAANALFVYLRNMQQNERITWGMLAEIAGGSAQKEYKYAWLLARKRLMDEQHLVFDSIKGIGYIIADNSKIINKGGFSTIKSIHTTATKGSNTLDCIGGHGGVLSLSEYERENWNLCKTELNFIKIMTSQNKLDDMRPKIRENNDMMTTQKVIEFLARN